MAMVGHAVSLKNIADFTKRTANSSEISIRRAGRRTADMTYEAGYYLLEKVKSAVRVSDAVVDAAYNFKDLIAVHVLAATDGHNASESYFVRASGEFGERQALRDGKNALKRAGCVISGGSILEREEILYESGVVVFRDKEVGTISIRSKVASLGEGNPKAKKQLERAGYIVAIVYKN